VVADVVEATVKALDTAVKHIVEAIDAVIVIRKDGVVVVAVHPSPALECY
jgi:hypothetical protein